MNFARCAVIRRAATVALVSGVLLGACGKGSSSSATSAATSTSRATTSTTAGSFGPLTTIAAPMSQTKFCQDAASLTTYLEAVGRATAGAPGPSPAVAAAAQHEIDVIGTLISEAPDPTVLSELKSEQSAATPFLQAVVAANGDISKVPQSALAPAADPSVKAAGQALAMYLQTQCGITVSNPSSTPSSTPGSTPGSTTSGG